jgi:two-component system, chemotaxis family, protein-glutamate methylesterase/glutaminase
MAGGVAIVQDPEDAEFDGMPKSALEATAVDYCVPVSDIAPLLLELVNGHGPAAADGDFATEVPLETVDEAHDPNDAHRSEELGTVAPFTCPDCHGTLWQISGNGPVRFRCRVGHAYSADAIVKAQGDDVERALWIAYRALEERAALLRRMAAQARRRGHEAVGETFDARGNQTENDAQVLHDLILNGGALEAIVPADG